MSHQQMLCFVVYVYSALQSCCMFWCYFLAIFRELT